LGFFLVTEMKYICYILFSCELNKFYIGYTTISAETRLEKHLSDYYGLTKYTHKVKDWSIFLEIECKNSWQARKIENHIKSMKSKRYINNLKKYPEMISTLLMRFNPPEN
jgi:putative endonuclease